jgi:para-nitrobenzyl esterase
VYDGSWLAQHRDVVVVTINHRLGALGYLHLGELLGEEFATSANTGNLDIVAALRWVRDNISAFGGDPGNVTIFGESGGGSKVSALMGMPDAAGLFHRAIIQSGPKLSALSTDYAHETALRLLSELGLDSNDARRLFEIPTEALIDAQVRALGGPLGSAAVGGRALGPVVDGRVLPAHPFDRVASPCSASVPLLIGTTKDEMTLFTYPNEALDALDDGAARALFVGSHGEAGAALYAAYSATRPSGTPVQRLTQMMTDRFRVGSIRLAERKEAQQAASVWMYRLDYETDVLGGALGAPHGLDVAYIFGIPEATQLSGTRPGRHDLAARMSASFTAFARTGTPQTDLLPEWAPYDATTRTTMIFDTNCHAVQDPDGAERQAWDGLIAGV